MILPSDIQHKYKELGYGTLKEIMKAIGINNYSHASNIMSGKASTSVANIKKIKKFVEKREALKTELSQNDQN
jgi:hypothetical protein